MSDDSLFGTLKQAGTNLPADGTVGYAPYALFYKFRDGLYINNNDQTGCAFIAVTDANTLAFSSSDTINVDTALLQLYEILRNHTEPHVPARDLIYIQNLRLNRFMHQMAQTILALTNLLPGIGSLECKYLDLENCRLITVSDIGVPLDATTAPALGIVTNAWAVTWPSSNNVPITVQFAYPLDMDVRFPYTINLALKSGGATDTPKITVGVYEWVADTNRGDETGAISDTLAVKTVTVQPTNSAPNLATVVLTPQAHTTDAIQLFAIYITYTKIINQG